jgi:hypothetical protein
MNGSFRECPVADRINHPLGSKLAFGRGLSDDRLWQITEIYLDGTISGLTHISLRRSQSFGRHTLQGAA